MRAAFLGNPQPAALRAINHRPEVEAFRSGRRGRAKLLGEMVSECGESYGQVFTRLDCEPPFGVEMISQSDMFAIETRGRQIRIDSMPRPEKHRVKRWQILLAGAGQMEEGNLFGRSVIADERLADRFLGGHAIALTFHEEGHDENLWAYAFLNTHVGLAVVRSCAYGTSVPGIRLDLLRRLPIPIGDEGTVVRVARLVREAVRHRERAAASLAAVRGVVESLPEMQEALELCARRTRRATAWSGALRSLSARSVVLAGAAAKSLKSRWTRIFDDVLEDDGIFTGPRFARVACEPPHGLEMMSQRDLFLVRPLPQRILAPGGDLDRLKVRAGTLLCCAVGQISEGTLFGRVFLAGQDTSGLGFSQNIMRFQVHRESEFDAFAFLSTAVGHRMLQSAAAGSGYLAMSPPLVRELPFPSLPSTVSAIVKTHVGTLLAARNEAQSAESEAIRIIEQEVLPQWLA